jgi:peptidoglycan/LPS O-acetylase OafA/YrhL
MTKVSQNTERTDHLLILKAISAIGILLYHMQFPRVIIPIIFGLKLSWITNSNGFTFIWIFFILSGYLIAKGFFEGRYKFNLRGFASFYINKFIRIAPWYYMTLLFIVVSKQFVNIKGSTEILIKMIYFNGTGQIIRNGIDYLWTVSIEVQWYLIAPFVCLLIITLAKYKKRAAIFLILAAIITAEGIRYFIFYNSFPKFPGLYLVNIHSPLWLNMDFFLFGILLNLLIQNIRQTKFTSFLKPFLMPFCYLLLIILYLYSSYQRELFIFAYKNNIQFQATIMPVIVMIFTGIFIFCSEINKYSTSYKETIKINKLFIRSFSLSSILQMIGLVSYEFYLIQLPFMRIADLNCWKYKSGCTVFQFGTQFVALVFISISIAWSMHIIQIIVMRKMKNYLQKTKL